MRSQNLRDQRVIATADRRLDEIGGLVEEASISPKDIHATAFLLLGIDPHAVVFDRPHRPYPIAGDGEVRPELLA